MAELDGRTALVTGASQGIGESVARRLATAGAKVVLVARSADKLERVAGEIAAAGGEALPFELDISKPDDVLLRLRELPEEFAQVDVLVNNAGVTDDSLMVRMSVEQWQHVLDTNLTGAWAVTRALLKGMMRRRYGRIVSVSSVVGLMGNPGQTNYSAAKAGLIGLSKSLAKEVGPRNITVNVVAPGYIETAMTAKLPEEAREGLESAIALRRIGEADDVAAAVLYLAGEGGGYVTGHVLNVSGGLYI